MENTLGSTQSVNPDARCLQCGQLLPDTYEWKKRRFTWGILLALATSLPFLVGLVNAFHSISAARTTGMGAVAGGFSEAFVILGIGAMTIFALGGIMLLIRGYSTKNAIRMLVSILGIAWCGLMLAVTWISLALLVFLRRH